MSQAKPWQTGIDPRGPRFAAAVTSVVLAVTLVGWAASWTLIPLGIQVAAFALGALLGLAAQRYGWLYRWLVRPRLPKPAYLEDPRPPRFAQWVGLVFAGGALLALILGAPAVGLVLIAFALAAALLNAVFNFCLGCEMYLLLRRIGGGRSPK